MGTAGTVLQQADLGDAYENLYDILKKMYWEASTIETKDEVQGVLEAVGDIIDEINQQDLEANTALFATLQPKIAAANTALQKVSADVSRITKNVSTAASAMSAIAKVVSLFPAVP